MGDVDLLYSLARVVPLAIDQERKLLECDIQMS